MNRLFISSLQDTIRVVYFFIVWTLVETYPGRNNMFVFSKKATAFLSLFCALSLCDAYAKAAPRPNCEEPTGTWVNELGSTLHIRSVDRATGEIEGTYRSPSGTQGELFPLNGWINSAYHVTGQDNVVVVSFSTRFKARTFSSVGSWSGQCRVEKNVPTISALFNLVEANAPYSWRHVNSGYNIFKPVSAY